MATAIRLVTLDVTNTILRVRNGVGGMYKCIAANQGLDFLSQVTAQQIDLSFKSSFRKHWLQAPNFGYGNTPVIEWWGNVTRDTLAPFSAQMKSGHVTCFCNDLYQTFSTASAYELLTGAKETLEELHSRLDVVVITNNDSRIRSVLGEVLGTDLFKRLLISNEQGVYKPNSELFVKAMHDTGLSANEVLHVGDSYVNDYLPASSLGMKALLFSTADNTQRPGCVTITELSEMLQFL